jgi:glycosyltransferase involved in cell wall biosynthesis
MMKVTFLTTSFPRSESDYAGAFVYDLGRFLARHGIAVKVLAPHSPGAFRKQEMAGMEVYRFPYFYPLKYQCVAYGNGIPTNLRRSWAARVQLFFFISSFTWFIGKLIRESDIVHAHWIEPGFLSLVWNRIYRKPLIVSLHRCNPAGVIGAYLYNAVLRHADYILFNGTYTRKRGGFPLSELPPHDIVPPGVDTDRFFAKPESQYKRDTGSVGERATVLGLGSLIPVKGFIHLIEAMPSILAEMDCQVVIGGDGPEREKLLKKARELKVAERLTLLGKVFRDDVPCLMRQADVFVLPSMPQRSGDTESLGMVLAEALSSGTPCVASHTGGVGDIVEHEVNGYLFKPGDASGLAQSVVALLRSPEKLRIMGKTGRKKIEEHFSLPTVSEKVASVYKSLLSKSS